MTIGEKIKAKRLEKGLTQKRLGELSGIAEPTIRRYESGKLNPKLDTIKKIAEGLGITPTDLMGPEWFDLQAGADKLSELKKDVSMLQALEQYLKSLGYSLSYEGPVNTTDPNVILSKGQDRTVFTSDQFKSFEKAIADSVDYQVWQQNHKK